MDEYALDVLTLTYMTVFLFVFAGILVKVPRRRNLLDTALTALVFMLAVSYLRSLLSLYDPLVFDTPFARNLIRLIAMVTITISVVSLWHELRGLADQGLESDRGEGAIQRRLLEHERRLARLENHHQT